MGLPYDLLGDVTDWRDLAYRTTTDLGQAPDDKVEARLRGLGGTVARLARALVWHGRARTAEIDELGAEIIELVKHLAPSLPGSAGAAR